MDFGFTNNLDQLESTQRFRDAAVADGWRIEATYPGHEDVSHAAKLRRDGWSMMILTRNPVSGGKWKYEASIHIWGPDGLAVEVPAEYNWNTMKLNLRKCSMCLRRDVETFRVSFAGRVCAGCLPSARAELEEPGWYN